MAKLAIVGAGLAGLTATRRLAARHDVHVFEKSTSAGGRMATRRAAEHAFDHGAQFFTARSEAFAAACRDWQEQGLISAWRARFVDFDGTEIVARRDWSDDYPHYVATPAMNALPKALTGDLDIRFGTRIARITKAGPHWLLADEHGRSFGPYDWVVLALPAEQAAAIAPSGSPLLERCAAATMKPCYALMLGFESMPDWGFDAAHVNAADISWMSVNSNKPDRSGPASVVVHSTNAWAAANLERDSSEVREHLLNVSADLAGPSVYAASHIDLHRWRYANADKQSGPPCFVDSDEQLGACGDWFIRGRVEAAFQSGAALAAAIGP